MILLKPANKIIHLNVGIKRRTISLTGFSETGFRKLQKDPASGFITRRSNSELPTMQGPGRFEFSKT
jgi:hypothetical protein